MYIELTKDQQEEKELRFIFGAAFLLTMFLFFIDEGFYDFRWMKSIGNWIIFFIYLLMIAFAQLLVLKLSTKFSFSYKKMFFIFISGSALALFMAFRVFG